ncbi:hypothetical protein V8D89_008625 [Ganoderma adspersum]
MAPKRSPPPMSRKSSTASDEKGLPSLNELFPEDLFRGSLPQHHLPSSSFQPLSAHSRPNPPLEPHPFPRQSPVLPGRSHPLPVCAHTPPPVASSQPAIPCTSGCCNQPSSSAQISPPHHHASLQHNQPRGWPAPATAGPSHPPVPPGSMASSSSSSHLRSPADEVVSAVTSAQWPWPYSANPHQSAYPHPQSGLAAPPESRNRGAFHDPHAVRHPLAYHAQISSGVPAARGGKTRYPDAPDVTLPSAATTATGRGIGNGIGKPAANASTTNADDSERRHCCPHCNKRFNRPSSLAIHVNTHTGAKPFTCAFPGCNRKFNVNSNMRRHYRNHLTARRRDAVARMVQPGPPTSAAGMSRIPSQLSPAMVPMAQAPVPMYAMHSTSGMHAGSPHAANSNLLAPMHHPHAQPRAHTDATSSRSGSTPISGYGSGSRSPSRSGSYSPSVPSPSPSPLPSPISAVTSPFPPTPRSLPAPAFRPSSPARLHPAHGYAYYPPQADSEKQLPRQERASPGWSADDCDYDEEEEEIEDELDADPQGPLTSTATATAQESYVRGERASSTSTSTSVSASGSERQRHQRRPRAESSPESRRARPYPYPSPRARAHRLSSASASAVSVSDGGEGRSGGGGSAKCEVPGCGCAAGRGAGGRLRPAFQDHPRELGGGGAHQTPGWTVLEDDSEDG